MRGFRFKVRFAKRMHAFKETKMDNEIQQGHGKLENDK